MTTRADIAEVIAEVDAAFDAAFDWLIEVIDVDLSGHMLHLYDGDGDRCGCRYEGKGLPR